MASVHTYARQGFGNPDRVAGKEIVIFRRTGKFDNTQLHDEMIHEFLNLFFRKGPQRQIPFRVDIQESGGAAE